MASIRSNRSTIRGFMMISDALTVNIAVFVAFLIRFLGFPPAYNWRAYLGVAPWLSVGAIILLGAYDLYELEWIPVRDLRQKIVPMVALLAGLLVLLSFLLGDIGFPRSVFVISSLLELPLLYQSRRWWQQALFGGQSTHIVLVSAGEATVIPKGLVDLGPHPSIKVVDGARYQPGMAADIFLLDPALSDAVKLAVLNDALSRRIRCLWRPNVYDTLIAQSELTVVGGTPFLAMEPLPNPWLHRLLKRALDVVFAAGLLVLSLPLDLVIAAAILLDDGAPVLFRQERVSEGNRRFEMLKFRTLVKDYELRHGAGLTLPNADGVTRVGRGLRVSHLDEIPQLWNVLKGDMSLVGPRPERPLFVDQFAAEIPPYNLRHQLKPGITGLAQLSGHYLSSPQEKLQMDLTYGRRSSLWVDLKILLQTVSHLWKAKKTAGEGSVGDASANDHRSRSHSSRGSA